MPSKVRLPDHVVTATTYAELDRFNRAFRDGHLNLLMIVGSPGTGKSQAARRTLLRPTTGWIEGHATGFGLYCACYEYRDRPVVIDDVDSLYSDRAAVRVLKAICQSDPIKSVGWHSDAKTLDRLGIPRAYTTTSRVCVIANEWRTLSVNVAAIEDRGCVLHFAPDAAEVHREVATWFWAQDIHDFVGDHLGLLEGAPSFRTYVAAWEFQKAGLDWRSLVLSRWGLCPKAAAVAKLKADTTFKSEEARARAFTVAGHGCRATYFNVARQFKAKVSNASVVPRSTLTASPPVPPVPSALDIPVPAA
jgi:hypothetical protein